MLWRGRLSAAARRAIPEPWSRMKITSRAGIAPATKSPRQPKMWKDQPVDDRRQQKSEGVALLQNPGEKAARLCRQRFHQERSAEAPLAAHPDSEKRAQDQEDREIRRERGQQFDRRIKDDVDHQRNATPESVAQKSEEQRAQRPEHQGEHAGERDFRNCSARTPVRRPRKRTSAKRNRARPAPSQGNRR